MQMNNKRLLQCGSLLSVVFAIVANYLVASGVVGTTSISEVSGRLATPLTPASYAFSIWSLIYLLIAVFAVYQARDIINPDPANKLPESTAIPFIIANLANGIWTYVFVNDWIGLSVLVLLTLNAALFVMIHRLGIAVEVTQVKAVVCVWWPIMIYAGWTLVANVVNIAAWLASHDITIGTVPSAITILVLGVALAVALFTRNVRELVLASTWGIIAIGVRATDESTGVAVTAFAASAVLVALTAYHGWTHRQHNEFFNLLRSSTN